jgi:predicted nuclease with TOPRIM domain
LEQQQADIIRSHNQECVELQTQVVDLRAALEKSEAERQQLGYEFDRQAVASREQIYAAANKEASFSEVNAALRGQVAELKQKITEQAEEAKLAKETHEAELAKVLCEIKMKVGYVTCLADLVVI